MLWSKGIIKEEIEKRAPISQGKFVCQTEVEIDIEEVCIDSASRRIKVTIKNNKERYIPKFKGRIIGPEGKTFVQDGDKPISAFSKATIYFGYPPDITPEFIEIIPAINQEGIEVTCENQKVKSKKLDTC